MLQQSIDKALPYLMCPKTRKNLVFRNNQLYNSEEEYPVSSCGIPEVLPQLQSSDSITQQEHYDTVSVDYINNLEYPHTQAYMAYLDNKLNEIVLSIPIGNAAEICCGAGEAFSLYQKQLDFGIGIDISMNMLIAARKKNSTDKLFFMRGDATCLPLYDNAFDTVFCLGGIHHVNDRISMFSEINRILKPGGRFIWREPVNDFFLWRFLRAIIYKVSSHLDYDTEEPLRYKRMQSDLKKSNMKLTHWETYGSLGFCIFMNSDVLVFNRLFRFLPGIRKVVSLATKIDNLILKIPGFSRYGLQVIGVAEKKVN